MLSRRSLLLALPSLACSSRRTGFSGYAFVANQEGKAIAAVDLSAFAVARHFPLDGAPTAVYAHGAQPAVYAITPDTQSLHEIHTAQLTAGRSVNLGMRPEMARFTPAGDALWILSSRDRQLLRVPLDTLRPDRRVALPSEPFHFDIALDDTVSQGLAAVTLGDAGQVVLVRLDSGRIEHTAFFGGRVGLVRFRKDAKLLLIAGLDDRQLLVYDAERRRLAVRLPLPLRPDQFCMKPDGGQLFITGEGMDALVTVHPYQTEISSTLLAGRAPGFVAVSSNPSYLFVANPSSSDVTIINIATQKVLAVASVGKAPCFIAVTPNSEYALVLNRDSGDIAVLHIGTLSGGRAKSAPLLTMIPVGSEPVSAVVRAV